MSSHLVLIILIILMLLGIVAILRSTSRADGMLSAQLLGTNGVAIMLLLAEIMEIPALYDAGLVFALLAAVTGIAFLRFGHFRHKGDESSGH